MEPVRVSFDLDEVLFVSPKTHETEPELPFPYNRIYVERLRKGTPDLVKALQQMGCEVWVYTSSYRTEKYIRNLFKHYGVRFDSIINAQRHLKEVQRDRKDMLPQKMPGFYRITLHVDDETVIATAGKEYGFEVYELNEPDKDWKEKVISRVRKIVEKQEYFREQYEKKQKTGE